MDSAQRLAASTRLRLNHQPPGERLRAVGDHEAEAEGDAGQGDDGLKIREGVVRECNWCSGDVDKLDGFVRFAGEVGVVVDSVDEDR